MYLLHTQGGIDKKPVEFHKGRGNSSASKENKFILEKKSNRENSSMLRENRTEVCHPQSGREGENHQDTFLQSPDQLSTMN